MWRGAEYSAMRYNSSAIWLTKVGIFPEVRSCVFISSLLPWSCVP